MLQTKAWTSIETPLSRYLAPLEPHLFPPDSVQDSSRGTQSGWSDPGAFESAGHVVEHPGPIARNSRRENMSGTELASEPVL